MPSRAQSRSKPNQNDPPSDFYGCNGGLVSSGRFEEYLPHRPDKLIMDTGNVELYPCLRCGLVFWTPRSR